MSGLGRKQRRTEARRLYDRFSKQWREEMRLVGLYGKKSLYKRPTFSQWMAMHERDTAMMAESTPTDVQEFLGQDPWSEQLDPRIADAEKTSAEGERGVATIQIVGDEEA